MSILRESSAEENVLSGELSILIRRYVGGWRGPFVLTVVIFAAVLAFTFNWRWLAAIGIAPLVLSLSCVAMCALGLSAFSLWAISIAGRSRAMQAPSIGGVSAPLDTASMRYRGKERAAPNESDSVFATADPLGVEPPTRGKDLLDHSSGSILRNPGFSPVLGWLWSHAISLLRLLTFHPPEGVCFSKIGGETDTKFGHAARTADSRCLPNGAPRCAVGRGRASAAGIGSIVVRHQPATSAGARTLCDRVQTLSTSQESTPVP